MRVLKREFLDRVDKITYSMRYLGFFCFYLFLLTNETVYPYLPTLKLIKLGKIRKSFPKNRKKCS